MPTNLYGPGDNYDLEKSHVIPAMLRKMHEARRRGEPEVVLWGTGTPRREFLHVDDLADALLFLMRGYSEESHVNVGVGTDLTIRELAETVQAVVGYEGRLVFDTTRPDGTPRKLVDTQRINGLGWHAMVPLHEGLQDAYRWFVDHYAEART
jgi:GDP-L-fucose synthase